MDCSREGQETRWGLRRESIKFMKFCVFNILGIKFCKNLMVCRVLHPLFTFSIYNWNLFSVKNYFIIFICIVTLKLSTVPKKQLFFSFTAVPVGYVGNLLEGFTLSGKKLPPRKIFPPPHLPSNYKPLHTFRKEDTAPVSHTNTEQDAVSRGLTLGETPVFGKYLIWKQARCNTIIQTMLLF